MQYFLSLCCIIKNERNLEEFIIYYIVLGVEHFFIYDNDSDYPIRERLNSFFYKKYCTIIDYPGKYRQMEAYNDCIHNTKNITKWLIVFDGDEYIVPKKHFSLRDFLNEYEDAHALGINWIFFGTSFHEKKQDGYLIDNFRYSSMTQDKHIKTICKPLFTEYFSSPHFVKVMDMSKYLDPKKNLITDNFHYIDTSDIININHYHTKSKEELLEKYNRGNADSDLRVHIPENIHSFDNDMINNYIANKYLEHIKYIHRLTGVHWLIYRELNKDLKEHLSTENEYYEHLLKYSYNDKRPIYTKDKFPDFHVDEYRKNNLHLHYLNDFELELYFISL